MKHIYPEFYKKFRCIADKCPDSCCKDWDVVVDDDTAEFYFTVEGEFGDKLKKLMTIDGDGDRIFVAENGRCPFWNKNSLCDIYIEIGEKHLCRTCREFPRLSQDYTAFTEHMLSFACPEAARIMLSYSHCFEIPLDFQVKGENLGYDADMMNFLLAARQKTAEIFTNRKDNIATRLQKALIFNDKVQKMLDEEVFHISLLMNVENCNISDTNCNNKFIFDIHKELDIMNKSFIDDLCIGSEFGGNIQNTGFEEELENLAMYYILRYYLGAIDSYDVISTIKRLVCAEVVITALCQSKNADFAKRAAIMQTYSKEVEHSYENNELLEEKFSTLSDFSVEKLIAVLNKGN